MNGSTESYDDPAGFCPAKETADGARKKEIANIATAILFIFWFFNLFEFKAESPEWIESYAFCAGFACRGHCTLACRTWSKAMSSIGKVTTTVGRRHTSFPLHKQ
jgi:hypothetical protein